MVIVGDSGVGKSSLMLRLTEGGFSEVFLPTIGVDFVRFSTSENIKSGIFTQYLVFRKSESSALATGPSRSPCGTLPVASPCLSLPLFLS